MFNISSLIKHASVCYVLFVASSDGVGNGICVCVWWCSGGVSVCVAVLFSYFLHFYS